MLAAAEDLNTEEFACGRLVVVLGAHVLRPAVLETLYGMGKHPAPGRFALVVTGLSGELTERLRHPALASVDSCVYLRRRAPELDKPRL